MDAKKKAQESVHAYQQTLIDLSHRIHDHPELGFAEEKASRWISEVLADAGFHVAPGICDLPTAFRARAGNGPFHVAICAEYDALPKIGHACGHNLMAAMATGAGIAAAQVADELGLTIDIIGTPAEEVGNAGGKILLLERGAFEGVHAAMLVHPTPMPFDAVGGSTLAVALFDVHYTGKASHAGVAPEQGINAADAMTIAQVAIGLLRQQLPSTIRISGIVTNGGEAANIIPGQTSARYNLRAPTFDELLDLRAKVTRCFEAGALATGAQLEIAGGDRPYAHMVQNAAMSELYRRNAEALGRVVQDGPKSGAGTDMGNISLVIPSIQPQIGINCQPAVNHQPEFAAACLTPEADKAVLDGALAMAWTIIDLALDQTLQDQLMQQ
ncbi:MAG TPA: M20 family metallopeptidase [Ktedonobacteraceae bacterium]|nr:M20 family metallopeptidase [Ktedonobacteraceae bacterium]